jgi:hypothetical protein
MQNSDCFPDIPVEQKKEDEPKSKAARALDVVSWGAFAPGMLWMIGTALFSFWLLGNTIKAAWWVVSRLFFCLLLLLGLTLTPGQAEAQWTVSDPTSYTYYVQQLQQQIEAVGKLEQQLAESQNILAQTEEVRANLEGAFQFANKISENYKAIKRSIALYGEAATLRWIFDESSAVLPGFEDLAELDDPFLQADTVLKETFQDRGAEGVEENRSWRIEAQVKSDALQAAIRDSEAMLASMGERMERLEELAEEIERTKNVKEALDLNNRYLAEILTVMTETVSLHARFYSGQSLVDFERKDRDATAAVLSEEPERESGTGEMEIDKLTEEKFI